MEANKRETAGLKPPFKTSPDKIQDPQQMIFSIFGELTHQTSVAELIRRRADERDWSGYTPEQKEEAKEDYTARKIQSLRNTGTMIQIRDTAQDLYKRYTSHSSPMQLQSTTQAYFLREAIQLWEKMQNYVGEYLEYENGWVRIVPQDTPKQTLVTLKERVERALRIQDDKKEVNKKEKRNTTIRCDISLPKESNNWWDKDHIEIEFGREGEIVGLLFDEHFSYTQYCVAPKQFIEAYKNGASLTDSQKRLFKDRFGMDVAETNEDTVASMLPHNVEIKGTNPISIFPFLIKPPLSEKIKDISRGHFYSTGSYEVGPLTINYRLHDFGEEQRIINLDTSTLSNEEVFLLIEAYLEALEYFPRVPKNKH